jgi:ribosomal protein L7Ae-like RNA K-turn-binding protein
MPLNHKTAALLGFVKKSGRLILGEFQVEQSIKNGRVRLVILAEDVKAKKKDILEKWCESVGVHFLILGTKEAYGQVFNTQPQGFVGVTDIQMAQAILGLVRQ